MALYPDLAEISLSQVGPKPGSSPFQMRCQYISKTTINLCMETPLIVRWL